MMPIFTLGYLISKYLIFKRRLKSEKKIFGLKINVFNFKKYHTF